MKKIYLSLMIVLSAFQFTYAQWTVSGNTIYNSNSGSVGIGTTTPNTKLDINGAISMQGYANLSSFRNSNNSYSNLFLGGSLKDNGDGTFTTLTDGGSNYFAAIRMDNSGGNIGAINFYSGSSTGGSSYTITNANLANYLAMTIVGGNVAIGTSNPNGYKLDVSGNVRANQITVNSTGADFVFEPTYHLIPLSTLKAYLDKNHHLPEIASAKEMQTDGLNLGENQTKLLQKVEELTLYLIEKDKELKEEHERNMERDKENKDQSVQLKLLQDQVDILVQQVKLLTKTSEKQ